MKRPVEGFDLNHRPQYLWAPGLRAAGETQLRLGDS